MPSEKLIKILWDKKYLLKPKFLLVQGRALPQTDESLQSFPSNWMDEFPLIQQLGFDGIEWIYDKKSEFTWIIDPIDGTKSYMSGRPLWGTMIGLLKNNKPIIGMVDFPELDQLWIGYKDKLILNGNDCNFLEKENLTLKNSIFASTAPELFEFLNLQKINAIIDNVKFNIWSGDCHNYILLAQGKIDLVIEENLNSWDILPLIPILKSREISITDWSGSEISFDFKTKKKFKVIAAYNKDLLNEVLQFLN